MKYITIPAVTLPPGELIYIWIGFFGFSDSKNNNWATKLDETTSLTFHIYYKLWKLIYNEI